MYGFGGLVVGFPNWHVSGCHFQEQVGWGSGLEKHNWHLKTLFMADIFLWSDIFSRIPINPSSKGASGWLICLLTFLYWTTGDEQLENHPFTCTKFLKYLEWFLECSKKSTKKTHSKSAQQSKSTFLSPQIIAHKSDRAFLSCQISPPKNLSLNKGVKKVLKIFVFHKKRNFYKIVSHCE